MTINRREILNFGVCLIVATAGKCIGLGNGDDTKNSINALTEKSVEPIYPVFHQTKADMTIPVKDVVDFYYYGQKIHQP